MDWCPFATRDPGGDVSAGAFIAGHPRKGGLHSTEGKSYISARGAYVANNSWPHFTISFEGGYPRYWQHVSISRASRAARNLSGGHETNRDGLIQIEIVGTCNPPNRGKAGWVFLPEAPKAYLDGIARLMRWIEENAGVERYAVALWKPYPESYGASNGIRLTFADWHNLHGWCGHQHFPENLHGDPGNINIKYLLGNVPAPVPAAEWKWSKYVPEPRDITSSCVDPKTGGYWVQTAEGGVDGRNGAWTYTGPGTFESYKDKMSELGGPRLFTAIIPSGKGGFIQIASTGEWYEFNPKT